jgi:hypothetical protein
MILVLDFNKIEGVLLSGATAVDTARKYVSIYIFAFTKKLFQTDQVAHVCQWNFVSSVVPFNWAAR